MAVIPAGLGWGWIRFADVFEPEPERGAAIGQVAVDRAGNCRSCSGVGLPTAGPGEVDECGTVLLVTPRPGGHVREARWSCPALVDT
jgi:hypothetical protein